MVRSGSTIACRRTPYMAGARRSTEFLELFEHEFDALKLVWPPPVVRQPRSGQAPRVAYIRIKVDGLIRVRQILCLRNDGGVSCEIFSEEVAICCAPPRDAGRRVHADRGPDGACFKVGGRDAKLCSAN